MLGANTKPAKRTLDARPDPIDFRDIMYVPTLVEVPVRRLLSTYKELNVPILNQGQEGACTGFGLATVAHYLLRVRKVYPSPVRVSPRMLYEMAKRYDEWPGTLYSGSSARGAMKGWHKHGVCAEEIWPYVANKTTAEPLTYERARNASQHPLGAYFRVNHKDIVAMHSAMTEAGVLYVTGQVHSGWSGVDGATGVIPLETTIEGGHAFAIVAYDEQGFWIQNSWGNKWGLGGFAQITYDDWLQNGTDAWVARLGVPVKLRKEESQAIARSDTAGRTEVISQAELRSHIVSVGNEGQLRTAGPFGTTPQHLAEIFTTDFSRVTQGWKTKHLLLYAHGGLVSEQSAVQRVADYRQALLEANVYPVSFVWKTDYWTTLTNILKDAISRRRPEGVLDNTKDFLMDRLDDALEQVARYLTGKAEWDEMKENALDATMSPTGAVSLAAPYVKALAAAGVKIHVVGHSAGSIFHAPLVSLLAGKGALKGDLKGRSGLGIKIATFTLWAPACTIDLFKEYYAPVIQSGGIGSFALFTLTDKAEQDDDCAGIYHKSLLYLVSNAFEKTPHIPLPGKLRQPGTPLLGMERFVSADPLVSGVFQKKAHDWILSPNTQPQGSENASTAQHHGAFDDDQATVKATLARILGATKVGKGADVQFVRSASSRRDVRLRATQSTGPSV